MTQKDKKDFENDKICRFSEKNIECDKVRDHCHLTGKYRGPAHSKCNINVPQDKSILFHLYFIIFGTLVVICFLKSWLIKRKIK